MDNFGEARELIDLTRRLNTLEARIDALEEAVKGLSVDSGRDWVSHVVHERLLADLHARMLREAPASPRVRVNRYLQAHAGAPVSAEP
jgi:hypothetical protein